MLTHLSMPIRSPLASTMRVTSEQIGGMFSIVYCVLHGRRCTVLKALLSTWDGGWSLMNPICGRMHCESVRRGVEGVRGCCSSLVVSVTLNWEPSLMVGACSHVFSTPPGK